MKPQTPQGTTYRLRGQQTEPVLLQLPGRSGTGGLGGRMLRGGCGGMGSASDAHTSTQDPQVTLAMTPVIALARSDAMMTAASATSDRSGRWPSKVPLLAWARNSSAEIPAARA